MAALQQDGPATATTGPLLELAGITRSFYGVTALDGVDFSVAAGTITGLIGPNGAGKTTLFNLISGLIPAESGRILFDSAEITNWAPERITARGLIRTFQIARGFPKLSVFDHLMVYGPRQPGETLAGAVFGGAASRAREAELAERAWAVARRLKLDRVIDNPVTALSGGQKKLLEIGRALMAEPRLILLDEPAAGVNPTLTAEIADHLATLRDQGITILLIAHDMGLIDSLCDPVIVMAEGRTLMQGSFAEVRADARVQEAYLGRRR